MKHIGHAALYSFLVFIFPLSAFAQTSGGSFDGSKVGNYLVAIVGFINKYVVSFIFAIAFIVFIWGVFQYFIAGGANEESRDKGKQFVMWGILGFFLMLTLWGVVNLLVDSSGLKGQNRVQDLPKFNIE